MMHHHTSVPYCSVPSGSFCFELYDMYSYERDEYDDRQRIRTCIYIFMNLISMKMVKCNLPEIILHACLLYLRIVISGFFLYVFSSLSYKLSIHIGIEEVVRDIPCSSRPTQP